MHVDAQPKFTGRTEFDSDCFREAERAAATEGRGSMRLRVGREKFEGGSGKGEATMGGSEPEGRRGVGSEI